jgi:hypothetical protein
MIIHKQVRRCLFQIIFSHFPTTLSSFLEITHHCHYNPPNRFCSCRIGEARRPTGSRRLAPAASRAQQVPRRDEAPRARRLCGSRDDFTTAKLLARGGGDGDGGLVRTIVVVGDLHFLDDAKCGVFLDDSRFHAMPRRRAPEDSAGVPRAAGSTPCRGAARQKTPRASHAQQVPRRAEAPCA